MGFGPEIRWTSLDWTSMDLDLKRILGPITLDGLGPRILDSPVSTGPVPLDIAPSTAACLSLPACARPPPRRRPASPSRRQTLSLVPPILASPSSPGPPRSRPCATSSRPSSPDLLQLGRLIALCRQTKPPPPDLARTLPAAGPGPATRPGTTRPATGPIPTAGADPPPLNLWSYGKTGRR